MNTYAIMYEAPSPDGASWTAYAPDLPGLIAIGDTYEECRRLIAAALPDHIAMLRKRGLPIPTPSTRAEELSVAA